MEEIMKVTTSIIIAVMIVILAVLGVVGYVSSQSSSSALEEDMLQLGQRYLDELEYEQAIACFEAYLEIEPQCVEAYLGLADAYIGLQDYQKALEVLGEGYAVTGDPGLQERILQIEESIAEGSNDSHERADGDQRDEKAEPIEPLVLDRTKTNVIAGNGGVIITQEDGLYGVISYQGNEILPNKYSGYLVPTEEGYFALRDEEALHIFDSTGKEIYEISEDITSIYISDGVVLYTVEDTAYWYDISTGEVNSAVLTPGVSITQMKDGVFNAWNFNWDAWPELDGAFWAVNQNGSVNRDENAVWGFEHFDYSYIATKADGYIPIFLWEGAGGFGLLDESGESVIWTSAFSVEFGSDSEFISVQGYYRDGLWLYNQEKQVVVADAYETEYFLLDLSQAVAAPAVLGGTDSSNNTASSVGSSSWSNEPAGRITNFEDIVLAHYDYIRLSDSGYYLASDGASWFYLDETGKKIEQTYLDCGSFYNGYAIVIDTDGMAYLIDTEFNKVSEGYPADSVFTAEAVYCIRLGEELIVLTAPEE